MTSDGLEVRFWGVRGSLPVSGTATLKGGGHTSCVEMRCCGRRLLFDAGSGAFPALEALLADRIGDVDLYFSHCHYDHIIGLPFLLLGLPKEASIRLWSGHLTGVMTTREMVARFMAPPFFPVTPEIARASIEYRDFAPGETLSPASGISVRTYRLNHPNGAIGFRVECAGKSCCYITDHEHEPGKAEDDLIAFIENTDLFIYDSAYTDRELPRCIGFGHSTWQHGTALASAAHVKRLALFHHSMERTDEELDDIERSAKARFPGALAARDGLILTL